MTNTAAQYSGPRGEAESTYDQLFPSGVSAKDHELSRLGLLAVGLHATLEAYARSIDIDLRRTPLPQALNHYLRDKRQKLEADTYQDLVELDETRHLFVHNRGVVTERYVANVPYSKLVIGERRPVSRADIERFSKVVWRAADTLRCATSIPE